MGSAELEELLEHRLDRVGEWKTRRVGAISCRTGVNLDSLPSTRALPSECEANPAAARGPCRGRQDRTWLKAERQIAFPSPFKLLQGAPSGRSGERQGLRGAKGREQRRQRLSSSLSNPAGGEATPRRGAQKRSAGDAQISVAAAGSQKRHGRERRSTVQPQPGAPLPHRARRAAAPPAAARHPGLRRAAPRSPRSPRSPAGPRAAPPQSCPPPLRRRFNLAAEPR